MRNITIFINVFYNRGGWGSEGGQTAAKGYTRHSGSDSKAPFLPSGAQKLEEWEAHLLLLRSHSSALKNCAQTVSP